MKTLGKIGTILASLATSLMPIGCRAPHYPALPEWRLDAERKLRYDLKGEELAKVVEKEFSNLYDQNVEITEIKNSYEEPQDLRERYKNQFTAEEFETLVHILDQNKTLSKLNEAMGIQRYVIEIADKNMSVQGLKTNAASLTKNQMEQAAYALFIELQESLRKTDFNHCQALKEKTFKEANKIKQSKQTYEAQLKEMRDKINKINEDINTFSNLQKAYEQDAKKLEQELEQARQTNPNEAEKLEKGIRNYLRQAEELEKQIAELNKILENESAAKTSLEKLLSAAQQGEDLLNALKFNEENLEAYRKLLIMAGSLAYLEGNIVETYRHLKLASEIDKELTGVDKLVQGENVLKSVFGKKLKEFVSPSSPLANKYDIETTTVKDVYETELKRIAKEAKGWDWESRDKIVQGPAYFLLNTLMQAHYNGVINTEEFDAAQRKVLNDIVKALGDNIPDEQKFSAGGVIMSMLPLTSIIKLLSNLDTAFTSNVFTPEDEKVLDALATGIRTGHMRMNGYENGSNFAGSNHPARYNALFGGLSVLGQLGFLVYKACQEPPVKPETPQLGGGGSGGPGTGN